MNTQFSEIVNSLKNLGRNLTDEEMVKKILRSLPEKWETKVTVLYEAKDLRNYSYDKLIGSLLTHEMMMKGKFKETSIEKKKRGDISLKMELSSDNLTSSEDDEVALIIRRFKRMFKKGGKTYQKNIKKMFRPNSEYQTKKETTKTSYFKCNKLAHFKANCPKLKKKMKRRKKKRT